jgi:predicted SAM-dependent methyltransferase
MKLELGSGNRPTENYLHQDIIQLETPLDFCCEAWNVSLAEQSLDEVLAVAVMEHLRFDDFARTLHHIHRLLKTGGVFYFDVPDIYVWSKYLFDVLRGHPCPYSKEDVYKTIWGWQRWPGDEHKSAWIKTDVYNACQSFGFKVEDGFEDIKVRVHRDRFSHPENAHIFVKATK